ncbi:hypothetical protein DevBK_15380 [Devosia sp. BK]|uniref:hypothetical protein n=1 Tax=unclassified Devosia TaxID=196773 RepID=UPI000713857C|nr:MULTISPECIES: hypothetical protein [unclassified Devosia]KQN78314.1 hypothetical protein ASE94_15145 [Devosia sp. Leaf64]KQT44216.1 hypothetical protein ASG47_16795 [Devosia sp. Leaf420]MDV3252720.1 hypothetical protein [Devosia sp. BK]
METDKDLQRTAVTTAITVELQRQAEAGAQRIDVEALAEAVLQSIEPTGPAAEGRRPEELNSSNDG